MLSIIKFLKGFGKYRLATYCPKHGIEINYFKDKATLEWALESNKVLWSLAVVQSKFIKKRIKEVQYI